MPRETQRAGPAAYISQWPLERTIGDLGQQIKQPSNPYANLSQRCVLQGQINALRASIDGLQYDIRDRHSLPYGAIDIGDRFALLRKADDRLRPIQASEVNAVNDHLANHHIAVNEEISRVVRWARLRLPNRQIVRTRWRECLRPQDKIRASRFVKVMPVLFVFFRWD